VKIRILIAVAIVAALALGGVYLRHRYNLGKRNIVEELTVENSMINVLLAGSNEFNDDKLRLFIVVSINPENKKIGLTFLPPRFAVDVDEDGVSEQISEFSFDNFNDLTLAIERELDIKIPFYSVLYSPDLKRAVDLAMGVDLFVYEEEKMGQGIVFGENYFDGDHLLEYINTAENNSIYYKYDRIIDIVFSLDAHKEKYSDFANEQIIDLLMERISTNLNTREVLSLSDFFFNNTALEWTLLPGKINSSGLYVMDEIARTVYRDSFLKKLVIEEKGEFTLKVKLLNATQTPGLAMKYRALLMREGINVVEFGTYDERDLDRTLVIDRKGNPKQLNSVIELIGIENIYQVVDSTQLHDVVIMLGNDLAVEEKSSGE
jgi:hypothetical protein